MALLVVENDFGAICDYGLVGYFREGLWRFGAVVQEFPVRVG